jgi:hypothetical protein
VSDRYPNAKSRPRKRVNAAPVINPKNKSNKVEVYHPTKGWRLISPKRMRALEVMRTTTVRGAAVARFISEGY